MLYVKAGRIGFADMTDDRLNIIHLHLADIGHLDHQGEPARQRGIKILISRCSEASCGAICVAGTALVTRGASGETWNRRSAMTVRRVLLPLAVLVALSLAAASAAQASPISALAPSPAAGMHPGVTVGFGVGIPLGRTHRPVRVRHTSGHWAYRNEHVWVPGELIGYDAYRRPIVTEGHWIVQRSRKAQPIKIKGDEIGRLARLQRTDVIPAQHLCATERGHLQDVLGRETSWIAGCAGQTR